MSRHRQPDESLEASDQDQQPFPSTTVPYHYHHQQQQPQPQQQQQASQMTSTLHHHHHHHHHLQVPPVDRANTRSPAAAAAAAATATPAAPLAHPPNYLPDMVVHQMQSPVQQQQHQQQQLHHLGQQSTAPSQLHPTLTMQASYSSYDTTWLTAAPVPAPAPTAVAAPAPQPHQQALMQSVMQPTYVDSFPQAAMHGGRGAAAASTSGLGRRNSNKRIRDATPLASTLIPEGVAIGATQQRIAGAPAVAHSESTLPLDTRVGKQRVERPCTNCGAMNHIRQNNCSNCKNPKEPPKKRSKRQRKKRTMAPSNVVIQAAVSHGVGPLSGLQQIEGGADDVGVIAVDRAAEVMHGEPARSDEFHQRFFMMGNDGTNATAAAAAAATATATGTRVATGSAIATAATSARGGGAGTAQQGVEVHQRLGGDALEDNTGHEK